MHYTLNNFQAMGYNYYNMLTHANLSDAGNDVISAKTALIHAY